MDLDEKEIIMDLKSIDKMEHSTGFGRKETLRMSIVLAFKNVTIQHTLTLIKAIFLYNRNPKAL